MKTYRKCIFASLLAATSLSPVLAEDEKLICSSTIGSKESSLSSVEFAEPITYVVARADEPTLAEKRTPLIARGYYLPTNGFITTADVTVSAANGSYTVAKNTAMDYWVPDDNFQICAIASPPKEAKSVICLVDKDQNGDFESARVIAGNTINDKRAVEASVDGEVSLQPQSEYLASQDHPKTTPLGVPLISSGVYVWKVSKKSIEIKGFSYANMITTPKTYDKIDDDFSSLNTGDDIEGWKLKVKEDGVYTMGDVTITVKKGAGKKEWFVSATGELNIAEPKRLCGNKALTIDNSLVRLGRETITTNSGIVETKFEPLWQRGSVDAVLRF